MLEECLHFLEQKSKTNSDFSYEVIIVSDGSTDGTVNVALDYAKKFSVDKVRLLDLIKNRGKGGAVRLVCQIFKIIWKCEWLSSVENTLLNALVSFHF